MSTAYSNEDLYKLAAGNYKLLVSYCAMLEDEGYWEQPGQVLKKTIYECLDRYIQSLLINVASSTSTLDGEHRRFCLSLTKCNPFDINVSDELDDKHENEAAKAVLAPPVLLQLCGLRDVKEKSGMAGVFFDAVINIIFSMSHLNGSADIKYYVYIKDYYTRIYAFIYNSSRSDAGVDQKYLFKKICGCDLIEALEKLIYSGLDFELYKQEALGIYERAAGETQKSIESSCDTEKTNEENSELLKNDVPEEAAEEINVQNNGVTDDIPEDTTAEPSKDCDDSEAVYVDDEGEQDGLLSEEELSDNEEKVQIEGFRDENEERMFKEYLKNKLKNGYISRLYVEDIEDKININDGQDSKEEVVYEVSEMKIQSRLDELLEELNSLIGLSEVKKEINSLINLIKVKKLREKYKLPGMEMSYHMVFTGNPGTGKTTVARLVAEIYKELGLLKNGNLIETDRSGLVAGYVGQTALKVKETVEKAIGGVLFIDEAYSLTNANTSNDFGTEAIDALVKLMEDNRDNLVVIAAGYTDEMKQFLKSNTGLVSRFNKFIEFPDYTDDELIEILKNMSEKSGFRLSNEAADIIKNYLASRDDKEKLVFGNARGIRNIFEKIVVNQANRIVNYANPSIDELSSVTVEDVADWQL